MKKTAASARKKPEPSEVDPSFAPVVNAFANDRQVSYGKMFASMGLKVNGKIFAMLVKQKLVVKLPKDRVDALVRLGAGEYFDPGHGRLMKEWVTLRGTSTPWVELAQEAHRFVKRGKA